MSSCKQIRWNLTPRQWTKRSTSQNWAKKWKFKYWIHKLYLLNNRIRINFLRICVLLYFCLLNMLFLATTMNFCYNGVNKRSTNSKITSLRLLNTVYCYQRTGVRKQPVSIRVLEFVVRFSAIISITISAHVLSLWEKKHWIYYSICKRTIHWAVVFQIHKHCNITCKRWTGNS